MGKKTEDNRSLSQKEIDQLKEQLRIQTQIVEALNKMIRIRILILLWVYKEQSINDLCKKLGKSWPTVTKHLGKLEEAGLLNIREEKSPGPKNKKIYSVKPDIIQSTRLGFDFLKLPPEDVAGILKDDLKSDLKTLEIIKKIFDDLNPYHQELHRKLDSLELTKENLEEFYLKKHVNYYIETLDEEEFEFYFKKYMEFLQEFEEFRREKNKDKTSQLSERPYIMLQIIFPMREIQEARFDGFWDKK
ncbi:MAG: helix-turn-helix domain-containing protein [Candidatus Lokiarchaeota archaeon]|nr:helix-turn-helix domain-containing protein [Candidatus Lokiarchaeota archaeon]MBD3340382.1 helix-turn-helix domain-containing protein [Candidatus Lokiarchaeota archaeon]